MSKSRSDRVVWGEGMLVCPQHLQQHDLFFENLVNARSSWPHPRGWGIAHLDVDEASIRGGTFSVRALRVIFPSGVVLDLPEGDPGLPADREIGLSGSASVVEVFIAVPRIREGTENYAVNGHEVKHARYVGWSRDVVDLVGAQSEVEVMFGRPRAFISFGHEDRSDYDVLKIAEVRRDEVGFVLSEGYVPAALRLSACGSLLRESRELLSLMVTKRRIIMDSLRQVDASRVEFSAQDVTRYLQLGAINSQIPIIRNLLENTDSSPYDLYTALCQLGGQLASFSTDVSPEDFPVFDHVEPRRTFEPLVHQVRSLLELAMRENFFPVELEARRDGMWIAVLDEPRLLDCSLFVLAVEADAPDQDVANKIPQLSKIASWKQIPKIVRSAIPGAPIRATHRPPPQIPIRPRLVYFVIDTSDDFWEQIVRERTIAIYLPPPFDPSRAKVTLMAVPSGNGGPR